MTARELLNLIDWLRAQGYDNGKIVECLEAVEGRRVIWPMEPEKDQE